MKYFFETAVKCKDVKQNASSHLAIVNGGNIRYLISNKKGLRNRARRALANNVSSYSKKLGMLMRSLEFMPDCVLRLAHLGRTLSVELPEEVLAAMHEVIEKRWPDKEWDYNIIVGSYVEKQKIVIQCFTSDIVDTAIYFKVCSNNAKAEIENETSYLRSPIRSKRFQNPKLCYSLLQKDGANYNIQATEEFSGSKVEPKMTQEIYQLFQEISSFKMYEAEDGNKIAFSHGDFVPWNLKHTENGYIIFDWEYCGMRFYGFDLIHYLWQIQNKLMGRSEKDAIKESIKIAKQYDEYLCSLSDEYIEEQYFTELRKQFGDVL